MTTKVDINVNVSGLLAKALQQTLANREGLVIREGRAKAEERGVKERRAQRIREGRNPETGDPLPSRGGQGRFGSDVQRIDEEPAANRRGAGLPAFYTAVGLGAFSGDGLQNVIRVPEFETPSPGQLPPLEPFLENPETAVGTTGIGFNYPPGVRGLTNPDSPFPGNDYSLRWIFSDSNVITLRLPLGDGTALSVFFRQSYVGAERVYIVVPGQFTLGDPLPVATRTAELFFIRYEYSALRVGQRIAEQVPVPEPVLAALYSIFPENFTPPILYGSTFAGLTSPLGGFGEVPQGLAPQRLIAPFSPGTINRYGLVGGSAGSCTPGGWFLLDPANYDTSPWNDGNYSGAPQINYTTQELLQISTDGVSIGDLLSPRKIIRVEDIFSARNLPGVFDPSESKVTEPGRAQRRIGSELPVTVSEWFGDDWRDGGPAFKGPRLGTLPPSGPLFRSFIYDWGQPGFCRRQARRYGIS